MKKFLLFAMAVASAFFADVSAQNVPEKSSGGKIKWYFIKSVDYGEACYLTADGDWMHGQAKASYNDPEALAKQLWCFTTDDDSLYTITCKYDGRVLNLAYNSTYEESSHLTTGEGIKYIFRTEEGRAGFGLTTDRPCPVGNAIMRYPAFSPHAYHAFWLVRQSNSTKDDAWFIPELYDEGFEVQNDQEVTYYNVQSCCSSLQGDYVLVDNTSSVDSKYNFILGQSDDSNLASQWRLVRQSDMTVAIINRATGNCISTNLQPVGEFNIPDADGKELAQSGYNISKISDDNQFILSSVGEDGFTRYLNAAVLAEEPAKIDFDNLTYSEFAWTFAKKGTEVGINEAASPAEASVTVDGGMIRVSEGADYNIYTVDGVEMPKNVQLAKGVYLVSVQGKTVKVIIR